MARPFRTFAEAYVAAIENGAALPSIRQALANLYAAGLALDTKQDSSNWVNDSGVSHEDWRKVNDSLARSLPVHIYYDVTSNPFQVGEDPEIGIGDLADDLADIWRDMKGGLRAVAKGVPETAALWHWKLMFDSHWGVHAAAALLAIHLFTVSGSTGGQDAGGRDTPE